MLGGVPLRAADPLEFFAGLGVELGDALVEPGGQVVAADDLPAGDQAQQQRRALRRGVIFLLGGVQHARLGGELRDLPGRHALKQAGWDRRTAPAVCRAAAQRLRPAQAARQGRHPHQVQAAPDPPGLARRAGAGAGVAGGHPAAKGRPVRWRGARYRRRRPAQDGAGQAAGAGGLPAAPGAGPRPRRGRDHVLQAHGRHHQEDQGTSMPCSWTRDPGSSSPGTSAPCSQAFRPRRRGGQIR